MNAVMKIGTLLIVTLSCLCFVEGLICNVCKDAQNAKCLQNGGICIARAGDSCATISYYVESRHVVSEKGCKRQCKEEEHINGKSLTYITCCDKNFCNSY